MCFISIQNGFCKPLLQMQAGLEFQKSVEVFGDKKNQNTLSFPLQWGRTNTTPQSFPLGLADVSFYSTLLLINSTPLFGWEADCLPPIAFKKVTWNTYQQTIQCSIFRHTKTVPHQCRLWRRSHTAKACMWRSPSQGTILYGLCSTCSTATPAAWAWWPSAILFGWVFKLDL